MLDEIWLKVEWEMYIIFFFPISQIVRMYINIAVRFNLQFGLITSKWDGEVNTSVRSLISTRRKPADSQHFWSFEKHSFVGGQCQQDGQCTYNATLWRVRITIVAVVKQ